MNRYRTKVIRPLALLVLALLVWIGAPLHANTIPPLDTDTPTLAPVENIVAESRGDYVATALITIPQYAPFLGIELFFMMCYHILQGCHAGCTAVVEAALALDLIEPSEVDAVFYDCVADYCPEGSLTCLELFPGLGF